MKEETNIYKENGFSNRNEYLSYLADMHSMDLFQVRALADVLGPNEDFDGLVCSCEDYSMMYPH